MALGLATIQLASILKLKPPPVHLAASHQLVRFGILPKAPKRKLFCTSWLQQSQPVWSL